MVFTCMLEESRRFVGCGMTSQIEIARENQIEAGLAILLGHEDQRGARLGLFDNFAEEYLITQETASC